ncbi:hypothetical protein ACFQZE_11650 [Paenibacillus sp. GCM10027627]|uniref:hypothetical protein n=1 Tax=unclassified Paenibacillus TaxID=185978 RepID=UPI00363FDE87
MRHLIVINVEYVEASPFVVALLYNPEGRMVDGMTFLTAAESDVHTMLFVIRKLTEAHAISVPEMWTSNRALYMETLSRPGVMATIKHPSDTRETRRHIEQNAEILRELYKIETLEPRKKAPVWRTWLYRAISKVKLYIKGDYDYEI